MIHLIVCGYQCGDVLARCRDSIAMQRSVKPKVTEVICGSENRKYLVESTVEGIGNCGAGSDDIIGLLDADDFLTDEHALQIVEESYQSQRNLLLTHGTYCNLSDGARGKFNGSYLPAEGFRDTQWRLSHFKTFKKKLWDKLDLRCLKEGKIYYKCCADRLIMTPLAEMAGHDRIKYIRTVLYCYDDTRKNSVWNTMQDESKRIRGIVERGKPYAVDTTIL